MENVVELKEYSVAEDIEDYLNGLETENTQLRYAENIKKFIKWKWDVKPEFLTVEDINKLTYTDMKKFKEAMRRKYAPGTVNNMLTTIYSLLRELKRVQDENTNDYVYDIDDIERLKVKPYKNKNVEHYGYLTWEETSEWIKFLDKSNIAGKDKKIAFIKLARQTGLRKESICNLTFSDIRKEDDNYVVHSFLKQKKHKIAIPDDLAETLLSLKSMKDTSKSKIFFSTKTAERLLDMIKSEFEIDESRNITLHSLRGLAAWEIYCSTKDILAVQKVLNHENINTSYSYIEGRRYLEASPTLTVGREFSKDSVKDITNDQWQDIFTQLPRSVQYEILNKADELGYSHE